MLTIAQDNIENLNIIQQDAEFSDCDSNLSDLL